VVSASALYILKERHMGRLQKYTIQQNEASSKITQIRDDILRSTINHDIVLPLLDQMQGYTIQRYQLGLAIDREVERLSKPLIQRIFRTR
jgi:hypothetical protein